jgi:hypothetical protein
MERKLGSAWLLGGLLAANSCAMAQGYFSFDDIPGLDSEPTVEIDLGPELMRFFDGAANGAHTFTGLEGITNVRVRVYEDLGDTQADLLKFVEDTSRTLERDGWRSVVRVNEDGERVRIFMKLASSGANAGGIEGLTVMVVDTGGADEAVFINVAGDIQPEQLGRIAAHVGMNGIFDMVPGAAPRPRSAP